LPALPPEETTSEPPLLTFTAPTLPPESTVTTPPALTVSPAALTAEDPPLAGQLTTVVEVIAASVIVAPAPLMAPPDTARMAPEFRVSPLNTAPEKTVTVPPPLTTPPVSVPAEETTSEPPELIVVETTEAPE
jgi:hypothetical protein